MIKTIKTQDELETFVLDALKDCEKISDADIQFDKNLMVVRLHVEGEKYNQTITTSVMKFMLRLQESIYSSYRQFSYGTLSKAERDKLELAVQVKSGSSDYITSLLEPLELLKEAASRMTGSQVLASVIIGIVALVLTTLGKKRYDYLNEKEKRNFELQKDNNQAAIIKQTIEVLSNDRTKLLKSLYNIGETSEAVQLDGLDIQKTELKERIQMGKSKGVEDTQTIVGKYRITRISFNMEAQIGKMDMYDVETDDIYTNVHIQARHIVDGSFAIIKQVEKKDPITLQIIVTKLDDEIKRVTLDKVLSE